MAIHVEDGTGHGFRAEVTEEYQLRVLSENRSAQFHASFARAGAWQCVSGVRTISSAGAYGILAIKNTGTDYFAATYIRVGIDDTETAQAQIEVLLGGTWVAGTEASFINVNTDSNLEPDLTAHYNSVPTSASVIDTVWIGPGPAEQKYNKEGSVILAPGKIIALRVTTETDSVKVHGRISLIKLPANGH